MVFFGDGNFLNINDVFIIYSISKFIKILYKIYDVHAPKFRVRFKLKLCYAFLLRPKYKKKKNIVIQTYEQR